MMSDQDAARVIEVAAVLPPEMRAPLAAAALTILAWESGITPRQAAAAFADSVSWPTDEEWAEERPRLERLVRNARATYQVSHIELRRRRPQG